MESMNMPGLRSLRSNSAPQNETHSVQFYADDAFLVRELSHFVGSALTSGRSAVVIATLAHISTLARELQDRGVSLSSAAAEGRYVATDAGDVLSRFVENGQINSSRFLEVASSLISKAAQASRRDNPRVVAFGEMVALLWAEGKTEAAIQLEKLWNSLISTHSFSLRCAYPTQGFSPDQVASFKRICDEHDSVVAEDRTALSLQKQASPQFANELQRREKEDRLKLFVDSVQDYAIFMLDPQGHIASWNAGAQRIKGYQTSEILGKHFSCFYTKEDVAERIPEKLLELTAREGRAEDEGWRVRKDGSKFWARVTLTAIRDSSGALIGFGKVTRDLTERHRTQSALREQEARFQLFIQAVQDYALIMLDPHGYITSWNPGAERIKGYKASEIIGRHFSCFYPPELRSQLPPYELDVAAREGRFEDEGWRLRKDGSKFWANVIITAVRDDRGKLIGFGKITRDLTDRMLAQKMLEDAQRKLRNSERSLRDVSLHVLRTQDEERKRIGRELHDSLGQYLSVLKMKIESMGSSPQAAQDAAECTDLVDECLKEVRTISYLLYPPMLEEMGLKSAIPWYLDGFSKRSGIKTTFDIPPDFGRVDRDVELVFFRVLQECLTNVQRHSGSSTADIRIFKSGNSATLQVTDQGKGLPDSVAEQAEQDWAVSAGVGLRGMSERVRQLGGSLRIVSNPGGTEVRATIPIQESVSTDTPV